MTCLKRLFSPSAALAVLPLAATFALCFAWFVQYGLGYAPCKLCLFQRVPYGLMTGFGLYAFLRRKTPARLHPIAWAMTVLAVAECGLAVFHAGVEQHLWGGLRGCMAPPFDGTAASLLAAPAVSCDTVPFTVLGLSMAGWNALYALGLSVYGISACLRPFKEISR